MSDYIQQGFAEIREHLLKTNPIFREAVEGNDLYLVTRMMSIESDKRLEDRKRQTREAQAADGVDAAMAVIEPAAQALYRQLQAWRHLAENMLGHVKDESVRDRAGTRLRLLIQRAGALEDDAARFASDVKIGLMKEARET